MPKTREKLVELLRGCPYRPRPNCLWELIADYLIANGVTVQQWISVKDRLPEQTEPATAVLGITKKGRCHIVYYYKGVTDDRFTGFYDIGLKVDVTHWMPLPQPLEE